MLRDLIHAWLQRRGQTAYVSFFLSAFIGAVALGNLGLPKMLAAVSEQHSSPQWTVPLFCWAIFLLGNCSVVRNLPAPLCHLGRTNTHAPHQNTFAPHRPYGCALSAWRNQPVRAAYGWQTNQR